MFVYTILHSNYCELAKKSQFAMFRLSHLKSSLRYMGFKGHHSYWLNVHRGGDKTYMYVHVRVHDLTSRLNTCTCTYIAICSQGGCGSLIIHVHVHSMEGNWCITTEFESGPYACACACQWYMYTCTMYMYVQVRMQLISTPHPLPINEVGVQFCSLNNTTWAKLVYQSSSTHPLWFHEMPNRPALLRWLDRSRWCWYRWCGGGKLLCPPCTGFIAL